MTTQWISAASRSLACCHSCNLLSKLGAHNAVLCCPRCGAHLHRRKPDSIARTWAFLIAALIAYVPANLLPMMYTSSLFGAQSDTIMSGVVYLRTSGSWPLAVIVFVASVMVPLLKIFALLFLVISVQMRSTWQPQQRTQLYRMVELVGRWSMLDIYVIAILAALVHFQGLMMIQAGPAAIAFGAVVVLTIFAAMSFDPRLIWDSVERSHD